MKQLPVGVYAVSRSFPDATAVTFRGVTYAVTPGVNAFRYMEELAQAQLQCVQAPFLGHEAMPVIIIPAGELPIGTKGTAAQRFRTYLPRAVAILGENAGISPNGPDLRTPAERRPESVLQGSFYFGAVALQGSVDGALILDGLTLNARAWDLRTGGKDAALIVKNCIIAGNISGHILYASDDFSGHRTVTVSDCRCDGLLGMNSDASLVKVSTGDAVLKDLYITGADRFLGMSNYAGTAVTGFDSLTLERCIVENGSALRCLTLCLPADSRATVTLRGCAFLNATAPGEPVLRMNIPEQASLTLRDCELAGTGTAMELEGHGLTVENCSFSGFDAPARPKPIPRTQVDPGRAYPVTDPHTVLENADFSQLDALYAGRVCLHGDFHCHSDSGGTSDGKTPLADYVPAMQALDMDFAAIVDHRQMRHFFLPEWDEAYLICGTEPGCMLDAPDRPPHGCKLDYTMIFPDKTGLGQVMEAFPEFRFTGGPTDGSYVYVNHTPENLRRLGEFVYSIGGLLSHAHPKQLMVSDDPLDYYFGDCVAIETIHGGPENLATRLNRQLWSDLLDLGKRVRTHGSSDAHGPVSNRGLTTVYAVRHFSTQIFSLVRAGDCTSGAVGMKMSVDGAPMGSVTPYAPGKVLYLRVGDFHRDHRPENTVYSLRIYTDRGLAYAREFDGSDQALALAIRPRKYYRAEVYNETADHVVAMSNPIFLD